MKSLVQWRVALKEVNSNCCQKILDDHAKIDGSQDDCNVRTLSTESLRAPVVGRSDADRRSYSVRGLLLNVLYTIEYHSKIDNGKQGHCNTYMPQQRGAH